MLFFIVNVSFSVIMSGLCLLMNSVSSVSLVLMPFHAYFIHCVIAGLVCR